MKLLHNRILRMAIGAPWYVRNTTIPEAFRFPRKRNTTEHMCTPPFITYISPKLSYQTCYLTDNIDSLRGNIPQTF